MVLYLFTIFLLNFSSNILALTEDYKSQQVSTTLAFDYEANIIFHAIDFPLKMVQDTFTKYFYKNRPSIWTPGT